MSFGIIARAPDNVQIEKVAQYYQDIGDEFSSKYARKYNDLFELNGSIWRSVIDYLLRSMKARKTQDDSCIYEVDTAELLRYAKAAKSSMESQLGKYIRMSNDDFDGVWFKGNISDDVFGTNIVNLADSSITNVARTVKKVDDIVYADESEKENEIWRELASALIDSDALMREKETYTRDDLIKLSAIGMRDVFTYTRASFDGIPTPLTAYRDAIDKIMNDTGIEEYDAAEFLSQMEYRGYCMTQLAYVYEPISIASRQGISTVSLILG